MKAFGVVVMMALATGIGVGQTAAPMEAPAGQSVPAGATGKCNDGTYSTAKQKWQACGGHKGVQAWFAGSSASQGKGAVTAGPQNTPATGAEAGKVWVNKETKVYHCPGSKFFGKTKNGEYMTEADAKKAGAHPDRGKPCGL